MPEPEQQFSGKDLVRQTLAAYKVGRTPGTPAPKKTPRKRPKRAVFGSSRDPVSFGAAVDALTAEQGWTPSAHGGQIIDQWLTLCPQYEDRVQPVHYDPDSGCLDLKPASPAYAAQLRLLGGQLCKQINDGLGTDAVRKIRILAPGMLSAPVPDAGRDTAQEQSRLGPVRTRETASPGYQRTLAIYEQHYRPSLEDDPLIEAARASLDERIAHPSRREPAAAFTDAVVETERVITSTAQQRDAGEAIRQAAIRAARAQKAGRGPAVRRAFEAAS